MKIIKSKNYKYKEITKISEYDPDTLHLKLQNIIESVSQNQDIYEAINHEFINLSTEKIEQIKDYVYQALGKPVQTSDQSAYTAY